MTTKILKKLFILFIITTTFFSSSFFVVPVQAQEEIDLKNYLTYFYNRYSQHFDEEGMIFKTPGYGIFEFRAPQTAREILSLATYYKCRALQGETLARETIHQAILDAQQEMNSRNYHTQSFSDAWTQMTILSLLDQIPFLLDLTEQTQLQQDIINRIEAGIQVPDTSNRAALGAVYWQHVVNNLYQKNLINADTKKEFDILIYRKIKQVLIDDIDQQYYYLEGTPMQFNPHYHLITAMAFASYAEITGHIEFEVVAKKMTQNLNQLAFSNGMVEAQIGKRPVGLGAQFYLGLGLLSYKFDLDNYTTFLNYAWGDRFFSDPNYSNRLEYHTTMQGNLPNYHDDISFSNLAELVWLTPSFKNIVITSETSETSKLSKSSEVIYFRGLEIIQVDDNYTTINSQLSALNFQLPVSSYQQPILKLVQTYRKDKLDIISENKKITEFLSQISQYKLTEQAKITLVSAYIYGGYNIEEIIDTIKNGPRAVHPIIPADAWRKTINYQRYLNQE